MPKPDFTQRKHFPGTHDNPFDIVLRVADFIQALHPGLFAALLLVIASLAAAPSPWVLVWWAFFLSDWALLAALPRAEKSFGPAKPPALLLALLRLPAALLPAPLALLAQLSGTGLVIYGFWVEPHRITVTRQTLRSSKLKAEAPPLRVLHLGDLHLERITHRERQLPALIATLAPDLIVFSGDFLNLSNLRDPVAWAQCREVIGQWAAPLGVYVVSGSPAVDLEEVVPELLKDLPNLRWLKNDMTTIEHHGQTINIVGLVCSHKPFVDGPLLLEVLGPQRPPKNFTLLIYHSPDLAPEAAEAGIDLQLSGHTHGGQVRLPGYGALYAASLYGKRFEMGRYALGDFTLYVTRGLGVEGKGAPRVRFLCPPEIILWEIAGEPTAPSIEPNPHAFNS